MSVSQIQRVTAGALNKVNDSVIAMPAPPFGPSGSQFAGQLGKIITFDPSNIVYDSTMGTLYGGTYQYVQLAANALAVVVGQIVFWDPSAADNGTYVVTTSESGGTDAAVLAAGIVLNSGWTAGNYSYIQIAGRVPVKFRAVLTDAGAIGSRCYAAAVGGADLGFADVLNDASPTTFGDVSLMQGRFLGVALTAPANGALADVDLRLGNTRP